MKTFNSFLKDIHFQYYIINKGKELVNLTASVQPIQIETKNLIPTFQIPQESFIQKNEKIEKPKKQN